jgi:hypothetical protein
MFGAYPLSPLEPFALLARARLTQMLILSLYNFIICLVAAVLYVAVNKVEPNSRHAAGQKILIIGVAGAAILAHLTQ